MGAKLHSLEELTKYVSLGYKVPEVVDILDKTYFNALKKQDLVAGILSAMNMGRPYAISDLPSILIEKIEDISKRFNGASLIVRSDSLQEGGAASFSGIYNSVVCEKVCAKDLTQAILDVYRSFDFQKAIEYRSRNNIADDQMEIILQRFIDPDFSGTVLTSNPSAPNDLTIEAFLGMRKESQPLIYDFDKNTGEVLFHSEDADPEKFDQILTLRDMGIKLEKSFGPSEIEFAIKDDNIYLLQRRPITDIRQIEKVIIPKYDKSQIIGESDIARGSGKVTLSAVKIMDLIEYKERIALLLSIDPEAFRDEIKRYYDDLIEQNKQFSEGYILITPHLYSTCVWTDGLFHPKITRQTTLDSLTNNKKALITTNYAGISSHAMTIAREQGLLYAGFNDGNSLFDDVQTGDIISIYFNNRTAKIFREKIPPRNIHSRYPLLTYNIKATENGGIHFDTSRDIGTFQPYVEDMEYFLQKETNHTWIKEPLGNRIGAVFTNENGQTIILDGSVYTGHYHSFSIDNIYTKNIGYKPLPKKEFTEIAAKYKKHLTDKT